VYKLLLCVRYLRTRFLAMICIGSVMLGVATLIVVNSVMSGFSVKLRQNLHNLIADVVIESAGLEGFADPEDKMRRIKEDPYLGPRVEAMSATVECFAVLQYQYPNGQILSRPVKLFGIDPKMRKDLGGFEGYLMDYAKNRQDRPNAFDLPPKLQQDWRDYEARLLELRRREEGLPPPMPLQVRPDLPINPPVAVNAAPQAGDLPAPVPPVTVDELEPPHGIIVGKLIAGFPDRTPDPHTGKPPLDPEMRYVLKPDDTVILLTVKGGGRAEPTYDRFVVVDYFDSGMSEYDSGMVFVDLKHLQKLRCAENAVTNIQIKLFEYKDTDEILQRLGALFPFGYSIKTWEQKQGPLLAAIDIERGVLNVLLFLIVGVAGFSILAIFTMIVAEKTRDIGIMKSLGASNGGVLQIFLGYGLLLGAVGAGLGSVVGLLFTHYLNDIEKWLSARMGVHVFDPQIYYFKEIPTNIETTTVVLVNLGAIAIAVTFSVLPALRAAMLHPVRALRFE
jgi:lipoprotein-releasing system permease protein